MLRDALLVVLVTLTIPGTSLAGGGRLFGVNSSLTGNDFLATIDKTTGTVTNIGPISFQCEGLSFGPDGRLFAADNTAFQLVTLDPSTAAVSVIGPYGGSRVIKGLAAHPVTGILYGITLSDALVTLDTSTGQVKLIGSLGALLMSGLEWSVDGSTLYAISFGGCLYSVDSSTGLATLIGCGDNAEPLALAADPADGQLYTAEWHSGNPMTLATVDASNGSRVVVATMAADQIEGLAFEPDTSALPVAYCTAKPNSLGCVPAIGSEGFPSSVASSGFTVTATNVRNQKVGVLLYTLDGRKIAPFQGGLLCLATPIRRTPGRNSNGSHPVIKDCSGGWRIDMNAFAAGAIGGKPVTGLHRPGTSVHCQWWGRDQGDPFGSALTNALQYVVEPD